MKLKTLFCVCVLSAAFMIPTSYAMSRSPKTAPQTTHENLLFVQTAPSGQFIVNKDGKTGQLILNNINKKTIAFTDRPQRLFFEKLTTNFIHQTWKQGHESFRKTNPNASISYITHDKSGKPTQHVLVVEISKPQLTDNQLVYNVKALNGETIKAQKFEGASLMIDDWGSW